MILSLLYDFLQFLLMEAGFILSVLGDMAPYVGLVLYGEIMFEIWGGKHEHDR